MNQVNLANRVWKDPVYFIAFGFGSGLMKTAPGTWGTVAAMPLFLLINDVSATPYLFLVLLMFFLGVWTSHIVSKELGIYDYRGIVWDEIVGYLLTMFMAPAGFSWMLVGFILFRIFDIWKPQPIRFFEQHIKGGWGIMLDDVIAAIPAWLILQLLAWNFS